MTHPGGRADDAPQSVLVIDDAQDIHDLIEARLRPEGVTLLHAFDAASGIARARERRPDLFLLDLDLDGSSGLDVCRQLKSELDLAYIPVIILTGTVDVATKVRAFDAGAIDYVTKPFDAIELRARVRAALRTKRYQDLLATRAQIDALTGLWNRAYFDARMGEDVAAAVRHGRPLGLLMVDLDHFKGINDRYGHPFGDAVLRQVAATIAGSLRASDVACRYGGEEFGVILRETPAELARLAGERIREAVAARQSGPPDRPIQVTVSVGSCGTDLLAARPTVESVVAAADRGLYFAKRTGRNRVCCGSQESSPHVITSLADQLQPPAAGRQPLTAGSRLGPYGITAPLGGGATGIVYRAFDDRLHREVAIKVLAGGARHSADGWRRFAQEARVLAALDHPSIVRIFDLGTADWGDPYIVLELLEGRTLRERLEEGVISLAEALRLALELLGALAAAHEKGIVHRDLKPENLFLTKTGRLKILDFGLAKRVHPLGEGPTATAAGMLLGTAGYLAPEQASGQPVDERSDIFAVGAILYELVSGQRAFRGTSILATLTAVISEEPPPLEPPALDAVLRRCLTKDPAQRIGSARELESTLLELALTRE
jgi:diguanylate cyclase (GGDEF)-like protein